MSQAANPKIRIKRLGKCRSDEDRRDSSYDIITRNALNRRRSFIEHIRAIPGIDGSGGEFASIATESPKKLKQKPIRTKYFIGQSSTDEDEEVEVEVVMRDPKVVPQGIEMRPLPKYQNERFLSVGMNCSW